MSHFSTMLLSNADVTRRVVIYCFYSQDIQHVDCRFRSCPEVIASFSASPTARRACCTERRGGSRSLPIPPPNGRPRGAWPCVAGDITFGAITCLDRSPYWILMSGDDIHGWKVLPVKLGDRIVFCLHGLYNMWLLPVFIDRYTATGVGFSTKILVLCHILSHWSKPSDITRTRASPLLINWTRLFKMYFQALPVWRPRLNCESESTSSLTRANFSSKTDFWFVR